MRNTRLFEPGHEKANDKARILRGEWYRQAGAAKPLYLSYPWQACLELMCLGERVPHVYTDLAAFFERSFAVIFMPKPALRSVAEWYTERMCADGRFLSRVFKTWLREPVARFRGSRERLEQTDLASLSNNALLAEWRAFNEIYLPFWREAIFVDSFDVWGSEILARECSALGVNLSPQELQLLTTPHTPSWIQKKDMDVFAIMKRHVLGSPLEMKIKNGTLAHDLEQNFPDFVKDVAAHARDYAWSMNDYATIRPLSVQDNVNSIKEIIEDASQREAHATIASHLAGIELKKKECIAAHELSREAQDLFASFTLLSVFRDHRKAYNQMGNGVIHRFASEASRRSGIALELIERAFCAEIPHLFSLTREDGELLEKRVAKAFYLSPDPFHRTGYYGEDAQELYEAANADILAKSTLKGMSAYEGVARGTVRLILTRDDFPKMQPGDILVAPNTRPEYVPVMRKAGAIITEEGGITCHAAIVSRELKIPCIVGVQSAIILLRDGEMVEVDAVTGVVKKME